MTFLWSYLFVSEGRRHIVQRQTMSWARRYLKFNKQNSIWRGFVRVMACVVVFCITYSLIIPAITMELGDGCTREEHIHSEGCYVQVTAQEVSRLACGYETLAVHTHLAACCDAEGSPQCGSADYVVHEHGQSCWNAGVLVCDLPEIRLHEHTDGCYEQPQAHRHTEMCYAIGEALICGEDETEGHTHTEACEELAQVCQLTEQPHEHGAACFTTMHNCGMEEKPAHIHGEACYEQTIVCGQEESTESREPALVCGKKEILLHAHTENCYSGDESHILICGRLEVFCHNHTEDCFVTETVAVDTEELTCLLTEEEGHIHTEQCFGIWELVCGMEEHTHTEDCYPAKVPETEPVKEEEPINTLHYTGADYEVVLRFDEWAGIPSNAELVVTELVGEAYQEHLERTYEVVGDGGSHTLVQFAGDAETVEIPSAEVAALSGSIGFARFFDITIWVDGEEIEPESTVEITIRFGESVDIPEGEKTAVHFAQNGTVEVLNAESVPMAMMSTRRDEDARQSQNQKGEAFVFWQDSFSVTGTITLRSEDMQYGGNTDVDWLCTDEDERTLIVYATFDGKPGDRSITIQVPSGFRIKSYSATEDTPDISGVRKDPVDPDYQPYIQKSELRPAPQSEIIEGITHSGTWESQYLTGYTENSSVVEAPARSYGGDIVYTLAPETNTVKVIVTLMIQQELLSHTTDRELLEPIQVITCSADGKEISTIKVTATGVPRATIIPSVTGSANVLEESSVEGRSEVMSISVGTGNFLNERQLYSFFESAQVSMTYPEGVFLETDTVTCGVFGYTADKPIKALENNAEKEVVPGHLSVLWSEDEKNGGGTITWYMKNGMWFHANNNKTFGADFRANTDDTQGTAYHDGDQITGFSIRIDDYCRNEAHRTSEPNVFTRTIISRDGKKNITLNARNLTRRDITADFQTEDYDYALGGINVTSALAYDNNTFYFGNPDGLKITGLNLMGRNARDIVIVTNTGREYFVGFSPDDPWVETGDGIYNPDYGGQYGANLIRLRDIDPNIPDDEYIRICLFTVDLDQYSPYFAGRLCGSFVYIGQFQDGDQDGSREGNVILRQLWDGTTYEQYQTAKEAGTLSELIYINGITKKAVTATDHTKIGWTNTGVGHASATVVNVDSPKTENGSYKTNTRLAFTATVSSGMNIVTQDILIDPVLVISLPEGISLDTTTVKAVSAAGILQGAEVELIQYGETRQTEVDGVIWKTYRFGVKPGQECALVALENHMNTSNSMTGQKITATFEAVVGPTCPNYDVSLQDVIMWDVRNTGNQPDELGTVTAGGKNGDATYAAPATPCVSGDLNNFLGHGTAYQLAMSGKTFHILPLIGLNMDLGIKPVASNDVSMTADGFVTYNGMNSTITPVVPDKFADVRLTYSSVSNTEYFAGSVIYVPIPKKGVDYAKYFENVNLDNPTLNETAAYTKTFGFSMDLTGPVALNSDKTVWKTFYALDLADSNPNDYENPAAGEKDHWEPVTQDGGAVNWLTEADVAAQNAWARVVMMKFVAQDSVAPDERGLALMRLHVHAANDKDDPALGGTYDYWRSYGKAVTNEEILTGNWKYSAVVAATPAMETVQGRIFVDRDGDGLFDDTELGYRSGIYTVQLHKVGGGMDARTLNVNDSGAFALLDAYGNPDYLTEGTYTLTIRRNADPDFGFANTDYNSSVGEESPENAWHNNVSGSEVFATWTFTVTNTGTEGAVVHRVGIGVKASVSATIEGVKTFQGGALEEGAFTFLLEPLDDAPVDETSASNDANGSFSFGTIVYEKTGTYVYKITEDCSDPYPGILYDTHTAMVTVTVTEDAQTGILSAEVSYDNSGAAREMDRNRTDVAAFTNMVTYELPQTGGPGDALFYLFGGILALVAITLLVHRKRIGTAA